MVAFRVYEERKRRVEIATGFADWADLALRIVEDAELAGGSHAAGRI